MTESQKAAMRVAIDAFQSTNIERHVDAISALHAALAEPVVEPARPPFGTKRKAAMAVYTPPFRFESGYIYDSQNKMVADDAQVEGAVASRVRGWGLLGYMPNGAALQDEIGQMMADALNAYYAAQTKPVVEPVAYHYKYLNHIGEEVWSLYPPLLAQVLETQALYASPTPPAEHLCKWPTCQTEEYQKNLADQIAQELVGEPPAEVPLLTRDEIWGIWNMEIGVDEMDQHEAFKFAQAIEKAVRQKALVKPVTQHPACAAQFNAAIDFAITQGSEAATFLDAWRHGDTSDWPEFEAVRQKAGIK